MKYKYQVSTVGVIDALIFSGATYLAAQLTLSDIPLPAKIAIGGVTLLTSMGAADSLVDIIKGTHHYLWCPTLETIC